MRSARLRDAALLALLLPAMMAASFALPDIWMRGEARESLVVRELVAGGDPIVPRREGMLASKPPLFHWLAAVSVRLAGPADAAFRFPSAAAACGMAIATFAAGMALFDRRRAWLAVGALLSTIGFWAPALEARVDMVFAACVATSLAGFAWWYRDRSPHARAIVYLASAAAVLTKGPAGAVLPAVVIVAALAAARDLRALRPLWATGPALVAATLVIGWYGLAWARAGWEFVQVQLVRENVSRALGSGGFVHRRATHPMKLLEAFAVQLLPWSPVAVAALLRVRRSPATSATYLLHAWWISVLAVFSVAAGKRPVYLLPAYPAVALLAADRLAYIRGRRLGAALAVLAAAVCVGNVVSLRHQAARTALPTFAEAVRTALPSTASIAARGKVSENDRLVLANRLGRPLPRLRRGRAGPDFLVTPRAAKIPPGCARHVEWPAAEERGLVLLACLVSGSQSPQSQPSQLGTDHP